MERAVERWRRHHGNAPSRLPDELADAYETLATHPNIGLTRSDGQTRQLQLRTGYYLVYRPRPRLRVVEILRVVHASELHG